MSEEQQKLKWKIGYRSSEAEEMQVVTVVVDECSPKEHYLYLYNVYTQEQEEVGDDDVVEVKETQVAKVVGFFSPAAWVYAISETALFENELSE